MKKYTVSHMTFYFKNETKPFFDNINLIFEPSLLYFIQGKNGTGKSTLFSILQGTNPPNSLLTGSLQYDSHHYIIENNYLPTAITSQVKTVIQNSNKMIAPSLTVAENLHLAQLPTYPLLLPFTQSENIPLLIQEFNINPSTEAHLLSGGQKQILAIIMSLQKHASILLLDEPTAALDDKNSILVMDFLQQLAKKEQLIIVIISHDKDIIKKYGEQTTITITQNPNDSRVIKQE